MPVCLCKWAAWSILAVFVKKIQKTSRREIELARRRAQEVE
jgi:phage-related protein